MKCGFCAYDRAINSKKNHHNNNILCFDREQFKYQSGIYQMLHRY